MNRPDHAPGATDMQKAWPSLSQKLRKTVMDVALSRALIGMLESGDGAGIPVPAADCYARLAIGREV